MKKHRDLTLSEAAFSLLEKNYYPKWRKYERLYNSKHTAEYLEAAKEAERSHLFIPVVKNTVDILEAIFGDAFFASGNPIEIEKQRDDDDEKTRCLNVLTEHYYSESKPYNALAMSFSSATRYGLGSVIDYWSDQVEMPVTRYIPPTNVAFDIDALTHEEIQYDCYDLKQTSQDILSKVKSGFYSNLHEKDLSNLLGSNYDGKDKYKRHHIKEIYSLNPDGTYTCRTFIKNKLAREKKFKRSPIKHGFLKYALPRIEPRDQELQCAAVGESIIEVLEPLVAELNMKRNQINDLHEGILDPYTMVGDDADISAEDAGKIKGVVNVGDPDKVKRMPPQQSFDIEKDVALLSKDIDDATAINGIQRGQTSSSDRRGASAMAIINANSSSRLNRMATTINDTLFDPWAKSFVHNIYVNAPDEVIIRLFGSNPFGKKGERPPIKYDVKVDFGKSINKDAKINELTMIVGLLNGREEVNVVPILMEVLKLILGDNADVEKLFRGIMGSDGAGGPAENAAGEEDGVVGDGGESVGVGPGEGLIDLGEGAGDQSINELDLEAAATNSI